MLWKVIVVCGHVFRLLILFMTAQFPKNRFINQDNLIIYCYYYMLYIIYFLLVA